MPCLTSGALPEYAESKHVLKGMMKHDKAQTKGSTYVYIYMYTLYTYIICMYIYIYMYSYMCVSETNYFQQQRQENQQNQGSSAVAQGSTAELIQWLR